MRCDPTFRYFMQMTGNDHARIFSTAVVAGRLVASWHLKIPVSGVVVSVLDNIQTCGMKLPFASEVFAPIDILASKTNPLVDFCGLQAASAITTGKFVELVPTNAEYTEAARLVSDIFKQFGRERLIFLTRALLMPPYTEIGIHPTPSMKAIEAQHAPKPAVAQSSATATLKRHAQPTSLEKPT